MAARRHAPDHATVIRPRALREAKLTLCAHKPVLQAALRDLDLSPDQLDGVLACIEHVLDGNFRSSETRRTS